MTKGGKPAVAASAALLMIMSPAKTLDFSAAVPGLIESTAPSCNPARTQRLASAMGELSVAELGKLLSVSAPLAKENFDRYQSFRREDDGPRKAAALAYDGPAFKGLDAATLSGDAMAYLQDNLRIISGLYGSLRPWDEIRPYRLEMATRNALPGVKKLQDFWTEDVTRDLCGVLEQRAPDARFIVDCASVEYSSAVDLAALPEGTRVIKTVFKNDGRVLAVFAKRARGLMIRHLAQTLARSEEDIKAFDAEGYAFQPGESTDDTFVFGRRKPPPKAAARGKKRDAPVKPEESVKAEAPVKKEPARKRRR